MHNVEACFPRLCRGKLGLSNTPVCRKTLSFLKPPDRKSSFAASRTVLDGIGLPGKGVEGTLQGSVPRVPRGSARFRQKRPVTGPGRPGSIQHGPAGAGPSHPFSPNPLGQEALDGASSAGSGSFLLKAQEAHGTEKMGMKPTIPLREKSGENPYTEGPGVGPGGPRGPPGRFQPVPSEPSQAPT